MRTRRFAGSIIAVALVLLGTTSPLTHAAMQPDPKAGAIQAADLPAGSTLTGSDIPIATLAKLTGASLSMVVQTGVVSAYAASFSTPPKSGMLAGAEYVELYRDAKTATTALSMAVQLTARTEKVSALLTSGLGTSGAMIKTSVIQQGHPVDMYLVFFTRDRMQVILTVTTLPKLATGAARQIAGAIDARLKHVTS